MSNLDAAGMAIEKTMAQYGRLGMRWGIRRTRQQLARDKVGENSLADPDAVRAVRTQQKIAEAGSLNVVSSKDLNDLVKRMELENKYIKATIERAPQTKKGDNFVKKLIKDEIEMFAKGKKGLLATAYSNLKAAAKEDKASKAEGLAKTAKTATKIGKALKKSKPKGQPARVVRRKTKQPGKPPVYTITSL